MTTVKIKNNEIEIQGHSGYAEKGKDIVCAAISVLSEATFEYLKATGNIVSARTSDAYFCISIDALNANGKQILKTFTNMINDLIKQYPKNIERI